MPFVEHRANRPKRREERDIERMRRASATVAGDQRPAMAVALAQIGAAFDEAAILNALKIRVEHFIRLGPQHAAVHARFSARAALFADRSLGAAVIVAERWWRDERKAFQIASVFGCAPRLSLEVLRELRLILRWMRLKRMEAQFGAMLEALCEALITRAAE